MQEGKKIRLKAILTLTTVILLFATLFGLLFPVSTAGSPEKTAITAGILVVAAFLVSMLFFRICIKPLISLWHNDKLQNSVRTRKQFADFMDDLPLGVFIKNEQSRAVYLNKYMDKIFGISNNLGKTPYNIFDKATADRVAEEDRKVLAGESIMVEEVLTDKNGKERVYMTHKFCMREDDETPRIGGISIEITRRREAEYKLRILSKAIRNSPVCIVITDPDGHIEFVNPAFVKSTGYSFAEVMGENTRIINSGRHPKSFFAKMWRNIKNGKDWQGEILNKKKDGTLFWEMVNISAVRNHDGQISHYIAIKDDISSRKQLEVELMSAKDKAEESDRLKSAFLANMSHEIRTPMNAIVGLSNLLGDPELQLGERESFSDIIRENSDVLLQLIDDIVDVSKIEAGQIIMRPTACNISSLMTDIHETFRLQAEHKRDSVSLKLSIEENIRNLHTITDPQRLRQILTNLIGNALKFTEKGIIEYGYRLKNDGNILFFVKDTGIGIPKEKLSLIFDRFKQLNNEADTKHHGGAGLGLSISKSLAELLGGSIWAESAKGKGSGFFFTIPLQEASPEIINKTDNPEFISNPGLAGKSILIVEDLEVNYKLIRAMLRKTGVKIYWAKTGKEALEMFSRIPALALVMLDLNMPDMHGYDILLKIKKERAGVPVIIQTAYALNEEKERCIMAGCDDYITKPIQMEQLLMSIQNCMLHEN